jgi:hypothetical protein
MDKLATRFSPFVKTLKMQHGEHRFEVLEDQGGCAEWVSECLTAFIPWSTSNACRFSEKFDTTSGNAAGEWSKKETETHDAIELNRCHVFIDPVCYVRITKVLGIDPPDKRLAIPRFHMDDTQNKHKSQRAPGPPNLTDEERRSIRETLAIEAGRRKRAAPSFLRVLADGTERARLELAGQPHAQFAIEQGVELVEIWTEEEGRELLVATHRIAYDDALGIAPSVANLSFADGKEIELTITPQPKNAATGAGGGALVELQSPGAPGWFRSSASFAFGRPRLNPMPAFALAVLVVAAAGWVFSAIRYRHELASQQTAMAQLQSELVRERQARTALEQNTRKAPAGEYASFRLVSDDTTIRSGGGAAAPTVIVGPRAELIDLELPITGKSHRQYRAVLKPFLEGREILSENLLPVKQNASGSVATLSLPSSVLIAGKDYSVELMYSEAGGTWRELDSFTFHVTGKQ